MQTFGECLCSKENFLGKKNLNKPPIFLSKVNRVCQSSQASFFIAQEELYNIKFVPQNFSSTECLTEKQNFKLLPTKYLRMYIT